MRLAAWISGTQIPSQNLRVQTQAHPGVAHMTAHVHSMHACGHGMGFADRVTCKRHRCFGMLQRACAWAVSTKPTCMHTAKACRTCSAKLQRTVCQQHRLVLSQHVELLDHFLGAVNTVPRNTQMATSPWRYSNVCF